MEKEKDVTLCGDLKHRRSECEKYTEWRNKKGLSLKPITAKGDGDSEASVFSEDDEPDVGGHMKSMRVTRLICVKTCHCASVGVADLRQRSSQTERWRNRFTALCDDMSPESESQSDSNRMTDHENLIMPDPKEELLTTKNKDDSKSEVTAGMKKTRNQRRCERARMTRDKGAEDHAELDRAITTAKEEKGRDDLDDGVEEAKWSRRCTTVIGSEEELDRVLEGSSRQACPPALRGKGEEHRRRLRQHLKTTREQRGKGTPIWIMMDS